MARRNEGEPPQSQWVVGFVKKLSALPLVLNEDQVAERVCCDRLRLERLVATGQIRVIYYEPDGRPRFLLREVCRFLQGAAEAEQN